MELLIIISSILRRYHFVLENPGEKVSASTDHILLISEIYASI